MPQKVLLAMSGGGDSTVAAILLLDGGYEVEGVTFTVNAPNGLPSCAAHSGASAEAASKAASKLGIAHHTADLTNEFDREVLEPFRSGYLSGCTPNPCVLCNRAIKADALPARASDAGIAFDLIATGHYARLVRGDDGSTSLLRGADHAKDQAYFLSMLTRRQLAGMILPLGGLSKAEVREIARSRGFDDAADRSESQDFAGGAGLARLLGPDALKPGSIFTTRGEVIGSHGGWALFTRGQRHGLGLGGMAAPLYVISIDPASGSVIVGPREDLLTRSLVAGPMNWIAWDGEPPAGFRAKARMRSTGGFAGASVTPSRGDPSMVDVEFDEPVSTAVPGQYLVLFDGDAVLGAGPVRSLEKDPRPSRGTGEGRPGSSAGAEGSPE